jgi:hypothetical protein
MLCDHGGYMLSGCSTDLDEPKEWFLPCIRKVPWVSLGKFEIFPGMMMLLVNV